MSFATEGFSAMINFFPAPASVAGAVLRGDARLAMTLGSMLADASADTLATRVTGAFLIVRFALLDRGFFALVATGTI